MGEKRQRIISYNKLCNKKEKKVLLGETLFTEYGKKCITKFIIGSERKREKVLKIMLLVFF